MVLLVAGVSTLEVLVAVSVQRLDVLMTSELRVATPATAVAVAVPPRVHVDVMVMESLEPLPVDTTLPKESSTETWNGVRTAPTLAVAGGSVVKATLVAVDGLTDTDVLVAVVSEREESVAASVHALAVSMSSALKVATPATAGALAVPPRAHAEVMVTTSVAPVPVEITLPKVSSTETLKVVSGAPAVAVVFG
jgi:hypothetical protein